MSDSSIKVAIKVRPLIKREREENLPIQWMVHGNTIAPVDPELRKRGDGGFQFDHIFNENVNNNEVFNTVVRAIVDAGVNGFNGTVFAYGQTSSGKTYTMMGTPNELGIIPLTVEHMFDAISNATGREFLLRVSYLEIYNEKVNDLLNKDAVDIKLHEDSSGQVLVKCKEEVTNSPENVLSIMKKGDKNRRIGETNMNDRSSRSHTIFRITIESREVGAASDGAIQVSQLNLVDLAGSERVRQTGATGERFKEGRHINQSLSTLALVIKQLSESQDSQKFANFRDSKLTRLLRSSLGGNAMTTIICAVTPAALEETQCTLSFACRARNIKNKPQVNEVMSDAALLKRYAKQLSKLNDELEKLKQDNRLAEVEEMESKLLEKDRINRGLEQRIALLQTRIVSSSNTKNDESFKSMSRRRRTWGGPSTFKPRMSLFHPSTDMSSLHTIKEMSPEPCSRKSMEPIDIMNNSFQIAFTDFELELIESERDRDVSRASDDASDSDEEVPTRRVKFKPTVHNVSVDRPNYGQYSTSSEPKVVINEIVDQHHRSPDTPKVLMREALRSMRKNLVELAEFTSLEKQLNCQDHHGGECHAEFHEVAKLKAEISALRADKDGFENVIAELQKELSQLKKEKEAVAVETSTCIQSSTESTEASSCFQDQQAKIQTLQHQVEELMAEKKSHDLQKDDAFQDQLTKIAKLEEQIVNVTKEKSKFKQTATELNERVKELEILYESDRKSHERKILGLEKLVDEHTLRNIEFEQQNAILLDKESQLQTNFEIISKLEKDVTNMAAEKVKFEAEITKLNGELNQICIQNKVTQEEQTFQLSKLHEEMQQLEAQNLQYKNDSINLRERLKQTTQLIAESYKKERDELIAKVEEASCVRMSMEEEHTRQVLQLQEQLKKLETDKLEYTRNLLISEERSKEHAQSSNESMEKVISELRDKLEKANELNTALEERHAKNTSDLRETLQTFESDKLEYERGISTLEEKLNIPAQSNMEPILAAISDLHSKLEEANHYNQTIGEKYEAKIVELVAKAREDSERLNYQQLDNHSNASTSQEKLQENIGASVESMDKEQDETRHECGIQNCWAQNAVEQENKTSALKEQLEILRGEKIELENIISNLRRQQEETNSLNCEYNATSNNLRKELEEANQRYHAIKEEHLNQMSELQKEIENLQSENRQCYLDLNNLREQLEKITSMNNNFSKETVSDLQKKVVEAQEQYQKLKEEQINEVSKLQDQIKNFEVEKQQHIDSINKIANDKISDLDKQKDEFEIIKKKQAVELSKLQEQITSLEFEKQQYEHTIDDLRNELKLTQSKNADLEVLINNLGRELDKANEQNAILKEKQSNHASKLEEDIQYFSSEKEHNGTIMNSSLLQQSSQVEKENKNTEKGPTEKMLELEPQTVASPIQQLKRENIPVIPIDTLENERENDSPVFEENVQTSTPTFIKRNRATILHKKCAEPKNDNEQLKQKLIETILAFDKHFESITSKDICASETLDGIPCTRCNKLREYVDDLMQKIVDVKQAAAELGDSAGNWQAENTLNLQNQTELQDELKTGRENIVNGMHVSELDNLKHQSQNDENISLKFTDGDSCNANSTLQQLSLECIVSGIMDEFRKHSLEHMLLENSKTQTAEHDPLKNIRKIVMEAMHQIQKQAQYGQDAHVSLCDSAASLKPEQKRLSNQTLEKSIIDRSVKLQAQDAELEITNRSNDTENNAHMIVKNIKEEDVNIEEFSFTSTSKDVDTSVIDELMSIKFTLEEDNTKLSTNLESKILELDEIKNDVQGLKADIQQLEKTIVLLTTENMEMSATLNSERERIKQQENNYQERIKELQTRISSIAEEKIKLERNLASRNEVVDVLWSKRPEVNDDEIKQEFSNYQNKIDSLTTENINLSQELAQRRVELEEIKQSKSLLYDHECIYKDKMESVNNTNKELQEENIQLSNSLIEKIEENDGMKEELEILKSKMETLMNTNMIDNTIISTESRLQAEIGELKAKMLVLTDENTRLSKNLLQSMNSLDNMGGFDNSEKINNTLHLSLIFDDNKADIAPFSQNNYCTQQEKAAAMQEEIEHLKRLNDKLSQMKLTPCTQCAHLKEANDSRREIKLQAKALTRKLEHLQKKFDRESADAEVLMKDSKDFNRSFCDLSLNTSQWEAFNVTLVEENVRSLNKELETVQDDHDKLTCLFKQKCDEAEKLQTSTTIESTDLADPNIESKTEKRLSKSVRMEKIECDMNDIRFSINDLKSKLEHMRSITDTYISERESMLNEISTLKIERGELQKRISDNDGVIIAANEKCDILENEVTDLTTKINQFSVIEKQIRSEKLLLEVELDKLKAEKEKEESTLAGVTQKLESLTEQQIALVNSKDMMEHRHKDELNSALKKYQDSISEIEDRLRLTEEKLNQFQTENDILKREATKLHNVVQTLKDNEERIRQTLDGDVQVEMINKLTGEMNKARKRIIKEIVSLGIRTDAAKSTDKSIEELFVSFLEAIMQKESELAKAMQKEYENSKQKLEDQKQQCKDAEKKSTIWAKELENEIEKLQGDIAKQETVCTSLKEKCSQLEHLLKESMRENETLREKMLSLETDFNSVQAELEMKSNGHVEKDEAVGDAEKQRRLVQEAFTGKEAELQVRMSNMKEEHERRVKDLSGIIETYKMKNMELKSNVDGLEETEKYLKNLVNMKSSELSKVTRDISKLMTEWEQLSAAHTETCRNLESKDALLFEMSTDLKSKCNLLSEYKMKFDTVMPEYETLKEQTKKRRLQLERYKKDFETLKIESEKEKELMQEKLFAEERNRAELDKSVTTLTSKNEALLFEMNGLQQKNEDLAQSLAKLERKVRNSTSKQKAETKIQELEDHIKTLQCNLDGATNRIQDLQDSKNQLLKKLGELEGQYEIALQENSELKKTLGSIIELQGKYHEIVQMKNQIALELEGNKLLLIQRNKDINKYEGQIKTLEDKNNELDAELEELAEVIREKDGENAVLEDKLNTCLHENVELIDKLRAYDTMSAAKESLENQVKTLIEENRMYNSNLVSLCNNSKDVDTRRQNEKLKRDVAQLRKENAELLRKMTDLESTIDLKNTSDRRKSASPAPQTNKRRQNRDNAFNERRHLNDILDEENGIGGNSVDILRKKVRELELEIVGKNGKLATLEMQIQSENFPYEKKCQELKELNLAYDHKNRELQSKIRKLERAMSDVSRRECDECRRRSTNKSNQLVQTMPDNMHCSSQCNSKMEDREKKKLKDEIKVWRDLCRSRDRRLRELEKMIKLEANEETPVPEANHPLRDYNILRQPSSTSSLLAEKKTMEFDRNMKQAMKENIPANIIDGSLASNYRRQPWNGRP